MRFKPLNGRVLVEAIKQETGGITAGGIHLPDASVNPNNVDAGKVVAVHSKSELKPGDIVIMPRYGIIEIHLAEKPFLLVEEKDIPGVF